MKSIARRIIGTLLAWQVRRLRKKNSFKLVGVVGSIGKTSTKLAIAQLLSSQMKVQYQAGNYNDYVTAPLVIFGQGMPSLFNPFAWVKTLLRNERIIARPYPFDVVVLELGTDAPGNIAEFKQYLRLDIALLTAITPEHMEFFKDLDGVAKEELSVVQYATQLVIGKDFVADEYHSLVPQATTYGIHKTAEYMARDINYALDGTAFTVDKDEQALLTANLTTFSEAQVYSALAAVTVADMLGLAAEQIKTGLSNIQPVSGRMQLLDGIKGSKIIDDSYNASPEAVKSALETIYRIEAPQKIALLGNMNELGDFSQEAHIAAGKLCDPNQLAELITLGPDANEYLAPAARGAGCKVTECTSPYEAGEYIKSVIQDGALVLVKGSQNRVFSEEAIKSILANPEDAQKLVRQSKYWLKVKQEQFK